MRGTFTDQQVVYIAVVALVLGAGIMYMICEMPNPPATMTLVDGQVKPEADTTTFILPDSVEVSEIDLENLDGIVTLYASGNLQFVDEVPQSSSSATTAQQDPFNAFTDFMLNIPLRNVGSQYGSGGSIVMVDVEKLKDDYDLKFISIERSIPGSLNFEINASQQPIF